ncbi:MAG: hypothetical protein KFF77_11710, partial [Bacteroidetes bacterium]|nr:hypothetical protein [Bacteroidota bacterium]
EAELARFVFEADGRLAGGEHVEWVEPHEFRYRGVMYDVARSQREGVRTVHYCVRDDAETAVFAQLDRMAREAANGGETGERSERILRHLLVPILPPRTECASFTPEVRMLFACAVPALLMTERIPADPPPET